MAAVIVSDLPPPLPGGPDFPASGASPAEHFEWCIRFASYCVRQAQIAREFDQPTHKWVRAAELAAFAAAMWRERAEGAAP